MRKINGMTLIALLVGAALSIFIVGGAITIIATAKISFDRLQSLASLQNEDRFGLNHLSTTVSQAGRGLGSAAGNDLGRRVPYYSTSGMAGTANPKVQQLQYSSSSPTNFAPMGWNFLGCLPASSFFVDTNLSGTVDPSNCSSQVDNLTVTDTNNNTYTGALRFFGIGYDTNLKVSCFRAPDGTYTNANAFSTGIISPSACFNLCQDNTNCGGFYNTNIPGPVVALYEKYYPYISGSFTGNTSDDGTGNDILTVMFRGDGSTIYDCFGKLVPIGKVEVNTFFVNSSNQLVCSKGSSASASAYSTIASTATATSSSNQYIILPNVYRFRVLYGEDVDGDGYANRYVPSDYPGLDLNYITAVKVGIIVRSSNAVKTVANSTTLPLLDTTYTTPTDNFVYQFLTRTINLNYVSVLPKYLSTQPGAKFTAPVAGALHLNLIGTAPGATLSNSVGTALATCTSSDGTTCSTSLIVNAGQVVILNYTLGSQIDSAQLKFTGNG